MVLLIEKQKFENHRTKRFLREFPDWLDSSIPNLFQLSQSDLHQHHHHHHENFYLSLVFFFKENKISTPSNFPLNIPKPIYYSTTLTSLMQSLEKRTHCSASRQIFPPMFLTPFLMVLKTLPICYSHSFSPSLPISPSPSLSLSLSVSLPSPQAVSWPQARLGRQCSGHRLVFFPLSCFPDKLSFLLPSASKTALFPRDWPPNLFKGITDWRTWENKAHICLFIIQTSFQQPQLHVRCWGSKDEKDMSLSLPTVSREMKTELAVLSRKAGKCFTEDVTFDVDYTRWGGV